MDADSNKGVGVRDGNLKQGRAPLWSQAPSQLSFPSNRVDVWRVHLDESSHADAEAGFLSSDEITRANRFHFEKDRNHFSHCRSALRCLLARYVEIPPTAVRFEYQTGGKPQLSGDQNPRELQFNVSHSAGIALIAIGSKCQLGIDVERIRNDVDTAALAERFFSLRERAGLRMLPDHLRVPGFYACWTRKEAFLKATGTGLSFPLGDFSVTSHPDFDPVLEEIRGDTQASKQWRLADLYVVDGYRAALALDPTCAEIETYACN